MAGETRGPNEREVRMAALEHKFDDPSNPDRYEEIDLEDLLNEEDFKGYRIKEETLDANTWKDVDFPNLLPPLIVPREFKTLEFETFYEHEDPESHL